MSLHKYTTAARTRAQAPQSLLTPVFATVVAAALLVACGKPDVQTSAPPAKMPPVEVGVVIATPQDVGLVTELPGRVEASRIAQVRARVAGILQQRLFTEGSEVKAGQVLYRIDSAPYAAASDSAKASLAKAQANLAQATAQVERYRPLVSANAISKQDFANAEAAQKQAQADVAVARAAVRTADINVGYARVTSPISGRIGRTLVTEGALVGQGEATPLAVVQQIDPVYVNFTQSTSEVFALRRALASGQYKRSGGSDAATVKLLLDDGSTYTHTGKLLFTDLSVDESTGQVTLRAEVPNPKGVLLPGLYLRVQIEQAQATNAITLPQQAVTRTQQGDRVSVVDAEGKISQRKVKITAAKNSRWIVLDGLKPGEQVMVDGFQKLQMLPPGTPVKAVPWKAENGSSPTSPAGSSVSGAPTSAAASPASKP